MMERGIKLGEVVMLLNERRDEVTYHGYARTEVVKLGNDETGFKADKRAVFPQANSYEEIHYARVLHDDGTHTTVPLIPRIKVGPAITPIVYFHD